MRATLVLPGRWKLSKQNSYLARPHGGRYKNPAYCAEQARILTTIIPQLVAQGWRTTKEQVAMLITFYGPCMPIDWDNAGILTDSMQGVSKTIGHKRYRTPGPVVFDDRQFCPVTVDWVKSDEHKIVVELDAPDRD